MLTIIKNNDSLPSLLDANFSVSIINCDGIILYVNQLFCELSMYKQEELIGKHIQFISPENDFNTLKKEVLHELKTHATVQRKVKRIKKNHESFWATITLMPIRGFNNDIQQLVLFENDSTNAIQTKEKYLETLNELKNIEYALDQSTVVVITDQRGIITYANEKFCDLSQYSATELIGQHHSIVNSGYHSKAFFQDLWRTVGSGNIWTGDIKNRAKDGSFYWVNTTIVPFLNEKKKPYQYIAIRTDITDRKKAEKDLEIAHKNNFQNTVKNLQNAVFKYTRNEHNRICFTLLEGKLIEKLGVSIDDLTSNVIFQYSSPEQMKIYKKRLLRALNGKASHFEFTYSNYTLFISLSPIDNHGHITEVVGTIIDITDRKKAETKIKRMAYYDFLTGLPNRRLFKMKMEKEIECAAKVNGQFAVMFMDIDDFKQVNDSLGHSIGDRLLKDVAHRIQQLAGDQAIVGRQGGDEFVILLPNTDKNSAGKIARHILTGLERPFSLNGNDVFINASTGISIYPKDGMESTELLQNADIAMYEMKGKSSNSYHFFTETLHKEMIQKANLAKDLQLAIQRNQLKVYYQPQVDLKSGIASGVEALIRWDHPVYGMISPAKFIPIAEETGLIVPIGKWVLETACLQAKKWHTRGFPPIQMSVNVSPREFRQTSFVEQVQHALQRSRLHPRYLNLEITESMMSDVQYCQVMLQRLRKLGVDVSVDDFGTGYSSLSYLNSFPLTHLKIDQAFVRELNNENHAIVKTIINLAANLNLTVIAEGVETKEQATVLHSLSCHNVQGFLYSKPLPHKEVGPLLTSKF